MPPPSTSAQPPALHVRPARTPARRPARHTPPSRRLFLALGVFSLAAVTLLWLQNGGASALQSPALTFSSAGRLAGLIASDLLLIQVLLMACVPAIEASFGQDALTRHHRLVGIASFLLMLLHVALITVGYALLDGVGTLREAIHLVLDYPGMLIATAGTVLLLVVAVSSARAARRRLRYESWHLLHLYAYLGVGLALPHQLWTGSDFIATPAARIFWWGLYGATLATVVVFRLALPLARSLRHGLRVVGVVEEAPGVVSVHLRGRRLDRLPSRAGQFFHWRFLDGPGWSRAHPYSLSSAPDPRRLRITVKDRGDGSQRVQSLRPGTRVLFEGPFGRLTPAVRTSRRVTLLACGIGITPMRSLLEELRGPESSIVLIYRARREEEIVFRDELDALGREPGVRVVYVLGGRAHDTWLPARLAHLDGDDALRRIVSTIARNDVYVCGPEEWMTAAVDAAERAGVPRGRIHVEHFGW